MILRLSALTATSASWVLSVTCEGIPGGAEEVMTRLRRAEQPVVARVEDDRVLLDPRTVLLGEEESLLAALKQALGR